LAEQSQLPASFFQKLEFESDSNAEFNHRRRYQTDQFPTFKPAEAAKNSINDPFTVPVEFLPSNMPKSTREQRIRASSLSIPHRSVLNAFGTPVFASVWEPIHPARSTILTHDVEESANLEEGPDLNTITSTIDYLGLDDPYGSPIPTHNSSIERLRSISFPIREENSDVTLMQRSRYTTDFIPSNLNADDIPSWDEMVSRNLI
jgi:hypothetical protein